jgi:hypothetical protein
MAKLRISEYPSANVEHPDAVPYPAIVTQPVIDFSDNMVHTSQPFSGDTRAIRFSTDAVVCYVIGPAPVATLKNDLLPGEKFEYRWVRPGDSVSVIAAGTGGGGGGSLTINDGTNTVTGVTTITGDNFTVTGPSPNANLQVGDPTNTLTGYKSAALGQFNQCTNQYTYCFGIQNYATGIGSVSFGSGNHAGGNGSIAFGNNCTSDGAGSVAFGLNCKALNQGSIVSGSYGSDGANGQGIIFGVGTFTGASGEFQTGIYGLEAFTSDATPTVMSILSSAILMPDNSVWECNINVNGKVPGTFDYLSTEIDVIFGRGVGAGSTVILTTIPPTPVVVDLHHTAGTAATWSVVVSADTVNGGIAITVTGAAATTVYWEAFIRTEEIVA